MELADPTVDGPTLAHPTVAGPTVEGPTLGGPTFGPARAARFGRIAFVALLAFLAFLALGASGCTTLRQSAPVGKLRHVVLFAFKPGTTGPQVQAIEDAFRALPARIPAIVDFEWGTEVSVEQKADGFTHCFLVTFEDAAGRAAYLPHPAHQEFVKLLRPSLEKVLVIDYVVGK